MHEFTTSGWLPGTRYDELRAGDFERFVEAARRDLSAPVPTCPDWDVTGLCDHLARVYQGRTHVIVEGEFADPTLLELRPDHVAALEWLQRWSDQLDAALEGRPDDAAALTFMPSATSVHFWRRRMALETMVHRIDAQFAVGDVTPMDDALSADGVDELFWFLSHPEQDHDDGLDAVSVIELTDATRTWVVELADGAFGAADPEAVPDATVRASAPSLLLALSGRDVEGLGAARLGVGAPEVRGDQAAWERLLERLGGF